jgi:FAD synthase
VCEAHLLEYEGQLDDYGWEITLSFERWIRDQLTYGNVQSLTEQIERDIQQVRNELQFHHAIA